MLVMAAGLAGASPKADFSVLEKDEASLLNLFQRGMWNAFILRLAGG